MSILGIGGPELILIAVLVILILGPERAPQAARALGRQWRAITSAEWWRSLLEMWRFMRNLPQNLAEFAEVKEIQASLSEELEQVQSLTKGIQSDIESVSKPVEAILGGTVVKDTLKEMGDELTQSLPKIEAPDSAKVETTPGETVGVSASKPEVDAPAVESAGPPAPMPEVSAPATKPTGASIRLSSGVDDPGLDSLEPAPHPAAATSREEDERMMALAEHISEQMDQLPVALARLEELESQQAELESQLERLQTILDRILEQPHDAGENASPG